MARRSLWSVTKQLNAEGRLALFMGAGISMGCGLPSWNECVARVLAATWKDQPDLVELLLKDRNILATRYARQQAKGHFNRIVHDALYQEAVEISACVRAIAKSRIRHICNFNFDDLVAEAIQTEGIPCHIVSPGESFNSAEDGVIVYHPHGMLPRFTNDSDLDLCKIVFSEDDYHNLYSDPYSWANISQLSLLTSKSVLFIGLSMQDPNLRRLIDIARTRGFTNQHFAVFRDPLVGCRKVDLPEHKRLRALIELDMKSLGVTPWFVDSHEKVTEILDGLAINASRVRPSNSFKPKPLPGSA
jgi:hypothetical protein